MIKIVAVTKASLPKKKPEKNKTISPTDPIICVSVW